MSGELVLSIFPGIDLLGRAFEESGYCVVRGPDLIFGGDIRTFHPPAGVFHGVIGGPPCQAFSQLRYLQAAQGRTMRFGNLIPEFERCVAEARPAWFLMENVPAAPTPVVPGYVAHSYRLNNRWVADQDGIGAEQSRLRVFSFGTPDGRELSIEVCALEAALSLPAGLAYPVNNDPAVKHPDPARRVRAARPQAVLSSTRAVPVRIGGSGKVKVTAPGAVTSSDGGASVRMSRYSIAEACVLQGLPADYLDDAPFTAAGKLKAIANGVPLPMGRAIARAVRQAMEQERESA